MKALVLTVLFSLSLPAIAGFNEVECRAKSGNKEIYLEVEESFPRNSAFKKANLVVTENGARTYFDYTVTARYTRGFKNITYSGAGLTLDIDFWPDSQPRWARNYLSSMRSSDLSDVNIRNFYCTFPNIR